MPQIKTINVIECTNDAIISIRSFFDNEHGNKEAQELFRKIAQEQDLFTKEEIEQGINDCNLCSENADYQLFLMKSE